MSSLHQTRTELTSPVDPSIDLEIVSRGGSELVCRPVATAAERAICAQLRHQVFVVEQSIFDVTDRDSRDSVSTTVHLVADIGGVAGGTVRIYPLDEAGLWKGDRLAVARPLRNMILGQQLVRMAVRTAGELGGREMVATVQIPNIPFFERLGWRREGEPSTEYELPHQKMRIALNRSHP